VRASLYAHVYAYICIHSACTIQVYMNMRGLNLSHHVFEHMCKPTYMHMCIYHMKMCYVFIKFCAWACVNSKCMEGQQNVMMPVFEREHGIESSVTSSSLLSGSIHMERVKKT